MKKRINIDRLRAQVTLGYAGIGLALTKWLKDQPEDPNGVLIDTEVVSEGLWDIADGVLIPFINKTVRENMPGSVDPIDPTDLDKDPLDPADHDDDDDLIDPDEPAEGMHGHTHRLEIPWKNQWMTHRNENDPTDRGTRQRLFRIAGCGPDYGQTLKFVWSDGVELTVPNSSKRKYIGPPGKVKYQPGCGLGSVPHMEVYAKVGTNPTSVTMFYSKDNVTPSDTNPDEPTGVSEFQVNFGGERLPYTGHENRDRGWWTKIHGGSHPIWSQKFPLPKWVDDKSYRLDITYADGSRFTVPNTRVEFYMQSASGPKYRPEEHGEPDPRKKHPKVSSKEKTFVEWIKVVATPL